MAVDLKDFFLNTPMERAEYMKVTYKYFREDIRQGYNLAKIITSDGWVYIRIDKGIYGLKQAARIVYDLLNTRLSKDVYKPYIDNVNI